MGIRVLLVSPFYMHFSRDIMGSAWVTPPLGLAYLAGELEGAGHQVYIVDMEAERLGVVELQKRVLDFQPQVVGITSTTPAIQQAFKVAEMVKGVSPRTLTVLGGPHPSLEPEEVASHKAVDVVVLGEGERTFREIVETFAGGGEVQGIPGTMYRLNGDIERAPDRPLIPNLDDLPLPARHLFNMDIYRHPIMKRQRVTTLMTSRGCPYTCPFCNMGGTKLRRRSAVSVVDEIQHLISRYGIEELHFIDDTLTLDRRHIVRICEEICRRGLKIRWATPNGVNAHTIDRELASVMKKAGCYSLSFGMESGNQKTLDWIGKNLDIPTLERAFDACRYAGLESVAFIIIGFPNESREDIDNTIHVLKKLKPDVVDFHVLIPLPGTKVYEELKQANLLLETDWSKYNFHNLPVFETPYLSRYEIFEEYRRAYRKYHLRPAFILQRLLKVRTKQDVLNNFRGLKTLLNQLWSPKKYQPHRTELDAPDFLLEKAPAASPPPAA